MRSPMATKALEDGRRANGSVPIQVIYTMVAKLGGIGATTSLAGRIGANTGQYGIHGLQAFYMLCTAIAVRTCSTWVRRDSKQYKVSSKRYSIAEYLNG